MSERRAARSDKVGDDFIWTALVFALFINVMIWSPQPRFI